MSTRRASVLLAALLLLGGSAWLVFHLAPRVRTLTGFVSHTLCSGIFVSGLKPDQVYAETLVPLQGVEKARGELGYEIDTARREVRSRFAGLFESTAVFRDGLGCMIVHGEAPVRIPPAASAVEEQQAASLPLVETADPRLRAALDRAFAEPDQPPLRRTAAVVVVHRGRIVAERYAPGYRVDTPLLGWSVTKSVFNALIGILVRERRLSIEGPAPVPQWRDPKDPRHAITIDHLIRMSSGLDLEETNRGYDAVARMLTTERDMAGFAERSELKAQPGTRWEYTSGNTLVLSRIIRDAVGGNAGAVLAFARRELFEPLGMRNVTLEFDAAGTPIGSTYMYASARDWARFGMLFANDGVVNGRRILPEGWVRYSSSQTLGSSYAAGFWRGSNAWRTRWKVPPDAFFASGFLGQRVMVIPSEQLVIVRFGNAHAAGYDIEGFGRLVSDVIETSRQSQ